jgi:predicted small metal-binding protein
MYFHLQINRIPMKTISCKEFGIGCPWIGRAETTEKLLKEAVSHALDKHNYFWDNRISLLTKEELRKMMAPHVREE